MAENDFRCAQCGKLFTERHRFGEHPICVSCAERSGLADLLQNEQRRQAARDETLLSDMRETVTESVQPVMQPILNRIERLEEERARQEATIVGEVRELRVRMDALGAQVEQVATSVDDSVNSAMNEARVQMNQELEQIREDITAMGEAGGQNDSRDVARWMQSAEERISGLGDAMQTLTGEVAGLTEGFRDRFGSLAGSFGRLLDAMGENDSMLSGGSMTTTSFLCEHCGHRMTINVPPGKRVISVKAEHDFFDLSAPKTCPRCERKNWVEFSDR